ncbi:MAG: hypothetical protein IT285_15790, partial [Bdellovibrionales bacterium]|nr:hypothetical protein [Bdellovibrionales bacterium]
FDIDRSKLGAKENILLHLQYIPMGVNSATPPCDRDSDFALAEKTYVFEDDGTLTDISLPALEPANDEILFTGVGDTVYVGQLHSKFGAVRFVMSTFGDTNGNYAEEYWNGSTWSALTIADGTNELSQNGSISFSVPSNWAKTFAGDSSGAPNEIDAYWVRFRRTDATGTDPIVASIDVPFAYPASGASSEAQDNCVLADDKVLGVKERFTDAQSAQLKVYLLDVGNVDIETIQGSTQPRNLTNGYMERPKVVDTLAVLGAADGQLREEQLFIPLSNHSGINRIRVERVLGSAILVGASVYRMGQ